jgi:hypothetical protein
LAMRDELLEVLGHQGEKVGGSLLSLCLALCWRRSSSFSRAWMGLINSIELTVTA